MSPAEWRFQKKTKMVALFEKKKVAFFLKKKKKVAFFGENGGIFLKSV